MVGCCVWLCLVRLLLVFLRDVVRCKEGWLRNEKFPVRCGASSRTVNKRQSVPGRKAERKSAGSLMMMRRKKGTSCWLRVQRREVPLCVDLVLLSGVLCVLCVLFEIWCRFSLCLSFLLLWRESFSIVFFSFFNDFCWLANGHADQR